MLERENNRRSNQARRLHYKRSSFWADLPHELLEIISKSLNIVDYQNLGRVCRSWRLFCSEFKQKFLTSQSPLVVYASSRAKKYFYFFDIATGMKYKTKLPQFVCNFKLCLGVSSGYLIMLCLKKNDVSGSYLSVVNPVTGHQVQFPCMPQPPCIKYYDYRSIFATFGSQVQDFLIMYMDRRCLQFCTSKDNQWKEYYDINGRLLDTVVFDGRIYILNSNSQIGTFNPRSCDLRILELKFAPDFSHSFHGLIRLVASNDQLFVLNFPKVYRIDLSRKEWVLMYNFDDQALLFGSDYMMCSKVINPTKWGGQSNYIYSLVSSCIIYLRPYNPEEPQETIIIDLPPQVFGKGYASAKILSWYFLHQSSSIENVRDD